MKRLLTILSILLVLSACEKTIDLPIEYTEPKLVVNSITSPDSLWQVNLSASKYIYETGAIQLIPNAIVSIQEVGGAAFTLNMIDTGIYVSAIEKPIAGKTYLLSVTHPDFESVNSTSAIPSEVNLNSIEILENVIIESYTYKKVRITFNDPPGKNYYRMSFFTTGLGYDWYSGGQELVWTEYSFWINYQDPNSNSIDGTLIGTESILLSDEYFDGKEHSIDILIDSYYFEEYYQTEYDQFFKVKLHHVSREYYWFALSLDKYYEVSDLEFFTQPVQVYTNIENGLGIFASLNTRCDSFMLAEGKPFSKE